MNEELNKKGFIIIKSVFSVDQIEKMRQIALNYFSNGNGFSNSGGFAKPDWIKVAELSSLLKELDLNKMEKLINTLVKMYTL